MGFVFRNCLIVEKASMALSARLTNGGHDARDQVGGRPREKWPSMACEREWTKTETALLESWHHRENVPSEKPILNV